MSAIFREPTGILYFDELESPAFASVQAAWDRADDGAGPKLIWTSFQKDMVELGYARPTEKEMNRFISAVESGKILRPERDIPSEADDPDYQEIDPADTNAESAIDTSSLVLSDAAVRVAEVVTPSPRLSLSDPIADAFLNLRELLVAEAKAELELDIDRRARTLAAERIRSMAESSLVIKD